MIIVNNGTADSATKEAVLFPFDDVTIPFTAGLRMELILSLIHISEPTRPY